MNKKDQLGESRESVNINVGRYSRLGKGRGKLWGNKRRFRSI